MIERVPILVVSAGGAPSLEIVHIARAAGCSPILCDDRGSARRALIANRLFIAVVEVGDDLEPAADLCSWLRQQPGGRQIRIIACNRTGWLDLLPLIDSGADDIASFQNEEQTLGGRLTVANARLLSRHRESPFDFPGGGMTGDASRPHLLPHELLARIRQMAWDERDIPRLYRSFVEGAAAAFGFSQISIYAVEDSVIVLQYLVGIDRQVDRIPFDRGIIGRAVRTDRPIVIEDTSKEPEFIGGLPGITSEICVPFHADGAVIGVINIESVDRAALDERHLPLVLALRDHLEAAIAHIHAIEGAAARIRELEEEFLAAPTGLITLDSDSRVIAANRIAATQLGIDTVAKQRLNEQIGPESREPFEHTLLQIADGLIPGGTVALTGAGGRALEITLSAASEAGDEPSLLYGAITDVTARNETEAQLARSAEVFAALETSDLTIGFIDGTGRIELVAGGSVLPIAARRSDGAFELSSVIDARDWPFVREALSAPLPGGLALRARAGSSRWLELLFSLPGSTGKRLVTLRDVSEETVQSLAASASLQRYRESFDNPIAPSAVLDASGRFTAVSESLASLLGYRESELLGLAFQQLTYPQDVEETIASFRRLVSGEADECIARRRFFHREGHTVPTQIRSVAIPSVDGPPSEFLMTVVSLEREQELERRFSEVSGRYDSLVNALPIITFTSPREASDTLNLFYSPQVEAILGYTIDYLTRDIDRFYEFIHPDDIERINAADTVAEKENDSFDQTYRFIRGDGRTIWIRSQSVPVFGEGDEAIYWQGIMSDVTALKQSEIQAKEREAWLHDLVANAPFLVATIDRDAAIITINDAVERMLGYRASDLMTGLVALDVHPDDRDALRRLFSQSLPEAGSGSVQVRFRHNDGRWVRFKLEAISRGGSDSAAGVLVYGLPLES